MGNILGIDLGTTHSLAATLTSDGPAIISNALGERLTPSVVGVDHDGKLLVGRAAKELQVTHPERCASLFKRHMGQDWSVKLPGHEFTASQLSGFVLSSLKQDAEAHFDSPVDRAVITVPAYFNDRQRKATLTAGQLAGLHVERIVNEPTAAALAYGFHEAKEEKVLLIFDLGGGTFDVSIVELFEGTLEVRASSGESLLGGEDFTRAMAAHILEQQKLPFERTEMESPKMVSRLLQQCEVAKCALSRADSAMVRLPNKGGEFTDATLQVTVTRSEFDSWTQHHLARVELPLRRVLGDARLKWENLDEVILVGGATRMPAVVTRVTELFGKPPQRRFNPDEVVALGAAVQAGLIQQDASVEDLVVTDVCPYTLGVAISKELGLEKRDGYFLPVINRNTTIPVSRAERVVTLAPNQTSVSVKVYQGESRRVEQNLLIGEFEVTGVPAGPAGQPVELRFTYDLNGVLEVEATVVETGRKIKHLITRYARDLTPQQVTAAVAEMQKLKTHPREEAVNRSLLRRAERIYQELPLRERRVLSDLLDGFEASLSMPDKAAHERHREELQAFLDHFEPGQGDADWEPGS